MSVVKPKFFWPWYNPASSGYGGLVFTKPGPTIHTITFVSGWYYSAAYVAQALQTAAPSFGFSGMVVKVTEDGRFTFAWTGQFTLNGGAGAYVSQAAWCGFLNQDLVAVNDAATYGAGTPWGVTSQFQHGNGWYPGLPPRFDSLDVRDRSMNVITRSMTGRTKSVIEAEVKERTWAFAFLPAPKVYKSFEGSAPNINTAYERMFESAHDRVRFWPDATTDVGAPAAGGWTDYCYSPDAMQTFAPKRQFAKKGLYEVEFTLWGYVA